MNIAILFVCSYLLGAIPFGVLIARAHGVDLFSVGSGNIGATNVKRALGAKWGWVVFALDVLKGVVPAVVARSLVVEPLFGLDAQVWWLLAGLMAVLGHCVSPFLGFRGGKGIATALGMVLGAAWPIALAAFAVFIVVVAIWRYISLGSIISVPTTLIWNWLIPGQSLQLLPVFVLISGFIVYRHRANIARLREGTESKFSFRSEKPADSVGAP